MTVLEGQLVKTITKEELQAAFPKRKTAITDELVEIFNNSLHEPEFQGETLLQTVLTYESVIAGRSGVSIKDLTNAAKFTAYLVTMDDNATEAYKRTFCDRDFVKERRNLDTSSVGYRELTNAASKYRRSKTVVDLLTYSQAPLDIMFAGDRYRAVAVLAREMEEAKFSKDRIMAAKELLAATKGPENLKIALDVGVQESTAVQQLNDQLAAIAARQKTLLESGAASLLEFGGMSAKEDQSEEEGS